MTASIDRLSAAMADRYRIERELGAGGMATVFLAHDLKHDRDVAIKVLHADLGAALGSERFLSEIRTTARLQHPHILPLLDSGVADGLLYYVMPVVTGESLRARLERERQLPIPEAVRIAREVASALDYAHRHGVIHRDIKPENILLHDGQVQVADFGIALAVESAGGKRMTQTGLSLGTPQYMSPEQAMGERAIDARSDVYAVGVVTYEMLVGEPPFTGATVQAIVAKVLTEKPTAPSAVRDTVPPNVEAAVLTALAKVPADRFDTAARFAEALAGGSAAVYSTRSVASATSLRGNRPALLFAALAAVATTIAVWAMLRARSATASGEVTKFALALPPGQELISPGGTRVAFAPDGRSFVYTGPGPSRPQLWLRRLGELEAVPIPGSEGTTSPVFSPDGKEIAFNSIGPFGIKVLPVTGGVPRTVLGDGISGGGVTWGTDGYIYADGGTALIRIRPDGTGRAVVMALDTLRGMALDGEAIAWPSALPNGRGILLRVRRGGEATSAYSIVVVNQRDGSRKELVRALVARYSPTGHLIWVSSDGSLHAQRFDLGRLELTGSPVVLKSGIAVGGLALGRAELSGGSIAVGGFGAADLSLSDAGDLIYVTGAQGTAGARLVWVARDGSSTRVDSTEEAGLVGSVSLSPDGSTVAMEIVRPTDVMRVWAKRLGGGPTQLVTSEAANSRNPVWTPDGRDVLYTALGGEVVRRRRVDGSGTFEQLFRERSGIASLAISRDGRTVLLRKVADNAGRGDVLQFQIGADTVATPLVATPAHEEYPVLSPDGRWLAYASDESGRLEIYVRPFPDVDARKVQVSVNGGTSPRWKSAGELFFLGAGGDMMAARVRTTPTVAVDRVDRLFSTSAFANNGRDAIFDVSQDGTRFLMLDARTTGADASSSRIVIVQNFATELVRRLPR